MRLVAHANHVPEARLTVEDCILAAEKPRMEAKAFPRIFGIRQVSTCPEDLDLGPLMSGMLDDVQTKAGSDAVKPDVVIYAHANPVQAVKGSNAIRAMAKSHPFLTETQDVFEMDQNCCATLFWALEVAKGMIARGTANAVVILAGDSYSALPKADRYLAGCTVLGDAFTALLLDGREDGAQIRDIALETHLDFPSGHYGSSEETHAFNAAHAKMVGDVLTRIGHGADEPLLPHNINSFSWNQYCARTGLDPAQVWLDQLSDLGHCGTIDGVLNLDRFLDADPAASAVLLGLGQGGFVGGCRVSKSQSGGIHATC